MLFYLPENVSEIIRRLEDAGYEAYAVGGCVRDMLLGATPKDWDITTNAKPEEVKEIFKRTVDTGIKHGTVTVLFNEGAYEVTTYRIDGKYEDSRHPSEVTFTRSLKEDLLRRDFTINAMAYNESKGLVDCFCGREDLEKGVIRCVGDAHARFGEDALRILRAFRFAARFGFRIDPDTEKAAFDLSGNLKNISVERIREEITKTLTSPTPFELLHMYELGIAKEVMPGFCALFSKGEEARYALNSIKNTIFSEDMPENERISYAWGMLCAAATAINREEDPGESARAFTRRTLLDLKFDNDTIRTASGFAKAVFKRPVANEDYVRRTLSAFGDRIFDLWLLYLGGAGISADATDKDLYETVKTLAAVIRERKDPVSLKQLAVTGTDLIKNGAAPGVTVGECLDYLLDKALSDPSINTRETLLSLAGAYFANEKQS